MTYRAKAFIQCYRQHDTIQSLLNGLSVFETKSAMGDTLRKIPRRKEDLHIAIQSLDDLDDVVLRLQAAVRKKETRHVRPSSNPGDFG
jgi:hypothetical protein